VSHTERVSTNDPEFDAARGSHMTVRSERPVVAAAVGLDGHVEAEAVTALVALVLELSAGAAKVSDASVRERFDLNVSRRLLDLPFAHDSSSAATATSTPAVSAHGSTGDVAKSLNPGHASLVLQRLANATAAGDVSGRLEAKVGQKPKAYHDASKNDHGHAVVSGGTVAGRRRCICLSESSAPTVRVSELAMRECVAHGQRF